MLACLALLLNIPVARAEPGFAGVPTSLSGSTLLDLTFPALPSILGCLCLLLNPLITLPIGLSTFVMSWLCARSLSTLGDLSISLPRPSMLC